MSRINRFEDIEAWKEAREVVGSIYKICEYDGFRNDFSLKDQAKRAAVSIMANIAEGFARRTNKEFINFLGMSHASAAELQSHLYVAVDNKYITNRKFKELYDKIDRVSAKIQNFIKYLRNAKTLEPINTKT